MYSCANIGSLGGGPVDDKSPILKATNLSTTQFKSDRIELEFNEFITLNDAEKNIQIIPKHSTLKITTHQKEIIIRLDSQLHPNTTYNLIINGGIADNNAGNKFYLNKYFTVSETIDTSFIQLKINTNNFKNLKLCINTNNGTDSFKNFNTDYLYQNLEEKIKVYNNARNLNAWLYTDKNNDNKPDLYEPINFIKNLTHDSLQILKISVWNKPFKILDCQLDSTYKYMKLFYEENYNKLRVNEGIGINHSDYVIYTPKYCIIKLNQKFNSFIKDSSFKFELKKEFKKYFLENLKIWKNKNSYTLEYLNPNNQTKNTSETDFKAIRRTISNSLDTFIINQNNFDISNTFKISEFKINEEQKLAELKIDIIDENSQKNYVVILIKEGTINKIFYSIKNINEFIEPGSYKIEIYNLNYEEEFNPFEMKSFAKPIYEKSLYLKASWEEIMTIKL